MAEQQKPEITETTENLTLTKDQAEMLQVLKQMNLMPPPPAPRVSKTDQAKDHEFKFWNTQPVPALEEDTSGETTSSDQDSKGTATTTTHCPIENKDVANVRQEPYTLPAGFDWCELNLATSSDRDEVYTLLNKNYVEDDDNMFRFDYSKAFLEWALQPPDFLSLWHLGVRALSSGKLVAFISGIPANIRTSRQTLKMAEINFLCIHKKLRTKRLAPVLIKEITRRVNLQNIWQAVYTAGVVLPKPVGKCRYYHRNLNPKKLIETGFSRLPSRMTLSGLVKYYKLAKHPATPGFREMTQGDVAQVSTLVTTYLAKFALAPELSREEVGHWMLPRAGVINSYVVEHPETHEITDMCSFYHLPSTVIGHPKYSTLQAAYSYYNVATSVPLVELMSDCLISARNAGFDVFNALNLMDNGTFLDELKFGMGDGELQYYLYNWRCPGIQSNEVGLVLC